MAAVRLGMARGRSITVAVLNEGVTHEGRRYIGELLSAVVDDSGDFSA